MPFVIKMKKTFKKQLEIPEGAEIKIELPKIVVTGPLGNVERIFKLQKEIDLKKEGNLVIIECAAITKREKKIMNTVMTHLKNMVNGVTEGFEYKMQVCSIHFPITVNVDKENNLFLIKNFLGETKERTAKLLPDVEVEIKGDIITLKGIALENVSQCAANIEKATRVKGRDRRIYQDGIWITNKAGKDM